MLFWCYFDVLFMWCDFWCDDMWVWFLVEFWCDFEVFLMRFWVNDFDVIFDVIVMRLCIYCLARTESYARRVVHAPVLFGVPWRWFSCGPATRLFVDWRGVDADTNRRLSQKWPSLKDTDSEICFCCFLAKRKNDSEKTAISWFFVASARETKNRMVFGTFYH